MKKSNKTFILIECILALLVVVLALYMAFEKKDEHRMKVSVILQDPDDSEWSAFKYGLKMAAADQNVELLIVSTGEMLNSTEEKRVIEHEIRNGADAVIVQPVSGKGTEKMLEEIGAEIPLMLIDHVASDEKESVLSVTGPDQYELGKALANEVISDYNGELKGKTVGIFSKTTDLKMITYREKGVRSQLEKAGIKVHWFVAGDFEEAEDEFLKYQPETDIILALDDTSLTRLGEYAVSNDLKEEIYGIGNSTDAIYYLDKEIVKSLLVPDQYDIGYRSLTEIAEKVGKFSKKMQNQTVSYNIIRRDVLFSEENQKILYTMNQ